MKEANNLSSGQGRQDHRRQWLGNGAVNEKSKTGLLTTSQPPEQGHLQSLPLRGDTRERQGSMAAHIVAQLPHVAHLMGSAQQWDQEYLSMVRR